MARYGSMQKDFWPRHYAALARWVRDNELPLPYTMKLCGMLWRDNNMFRLQQFLRDCGYDEADIPKHNND